MNKRVEGRVGIRKREARVADARQWGGVKRSGETSDDVVENYKHEDDVIENYAEQNGDVKAKGTRCKCAPTEGKE
jgi:hypothetical protein